ncbi:hypothetical protein ACJX0J_022770, partial [Zea mays]
SVHAQEQNLTFLNFLFQTKVVVGRYKLLQAFLIHLDYNNFVVDILNDFFLYLINVGEALLLGVALPSGIIVVKSATLLGTALKFTVDRDKIS